MAVLVALTQPSAWCARVQLLPALKGVVVFSNRSTCLLAPSLPLVFMRLLAVSYSVKHYYLFAQVLSVSTIHFAV